MRFRFLLTAIALTGVLGYAQAASVSTSLLFKRPMPDAASSALQDQVQLPAWKIAPNCGNGCPQRTQRHAIHEAPFVVAPCGSAQCRPNAGTARSSG
jgi:hypothetical protein